MKILITGGAGYIGSVLIPKLLQDGFEVTCVDNLMYEPTSLMMASTKKNFNLSIGDARDEDLMKPLIQKADIIIPLACMTGAPLCNKDKTSAVTVNRDSVVMCSDLSSKDQLIIYPCTNSGYGVGEEGIFCTEESPLRPISLYGKVKVEAEKLYSLKEASDVIKSFSKLKFDSTIDLAVNLGVDPKKADQNVRGIVSLPNGTGKDVKVLALVTPDKEEEAKKSGADFVGLDEYLNKIKDGWTDVDIIITMPSVMGKLGPLGKILGPRGLMPNPKTGTVTMNIGKAVQETKAGKIDYKVDKNGTVHVAIGKVSFSSEKIFQNAKEVLDNIVKIKPSSSKGIYMKSIFMSSTMSPGIKIDTNSF